MATLSNSRDASLANQTQPLFTSDGILPDRSHLSREMSWRESSKRTVRRDKLSGGNGRNHGAPEHASEAKTTGLQRDSKWP